MDSVTSLRIFSLTFGRATLAQGYPANDAESTAAGTNSGIREKISWDLGKFIVTASAKRKEGFWSSRKRLACLIGNVNVSGKMIIFYL